MQELIYIKTSTMRPGKTHPMLKEWLHRDYKVISVTPDHKDGGVFVLLER